MPTATRDRRRPPLRTVEERNALVLQHAALVPYTLDRLPFQVRALGRETARDLAEEALLRACAFWRPDRGRLSTLVFLPIRRELDRELKRAGRRHEAAHRTVGWNDIQPDAGAGLDQFVELDREDPCGAEAAEDRARLAALLGRLPPAARRPGEGRRSVVYASGVAPVRAIR